MSTYDQLPLTKSSDDIVLAGLPAPRAGDGLAGLGLRLAASGLIPPRWFSPPVPPLAARRTVTGTLNLEIVSHCWRYANFLTYQLSSLVLFPPRGARVTMTVYHAREDVETSALLDYFGAMEVDNVRWQWRALPREQLFRRSIGRNHAALHTEADWIWFTDCDLLFRENCLDALAAELRGRRDALVYPREERVTSLLAGGDPLLDGGTPALRDIPSSRFQALRRSRAVGPLQITHGDVARACGYCRDVLLYQTPARQWCKAYEDRAFRWLLGTQGVPIDVPGVYRIRHADKGRYTGSELETTLRSRVRRVAERLKRRA